MLEALHLIPGCSDEHFLMKELTRVSSPQLKGIGGGRNKQKRDRASSLALAYAAFWRCPRSSISDSLRELVNSPVRQVSMADMEPRATKNA